MIKKMTSLVLESSDREQAEPFEGNYVEAEGGRIITTLKKQPHDLSQALPEAAALGEYGNGASQLPKVLPRKSILDAKPRNSLSIEQNIALMYNQNKSAIRGGGLALELANPGQGITFDQDSYEEYKIKSTESRDLYNFEAEK